MIRVGVLTSSRADYGIYLPLIKGIAKDPDFELKIIVFGTHLSKFHGFTLNQILEDGFENIITIESLVIGDTPNTISTSYSLTSLKFTEFWEVNQNSFDIIFALGDRFEMSAAVAASIPYQIKIAHFYGGDTTLGAIDNIYRHSISLASYLHFVGTDISKERLYQILDSNKDKIYNIGLLSLENLNQIKILTIDDFKDKWGIDLNTSTILVTVHPETVDYEKNIEFCQNISNAIEILSENYQIVITMPNADTAGLIYRESFMKLSQVKSSVKIIENFGTQSYFSCMSYCKLMIGNTSSGITEAATFKKYVLNLGERQQGRLCSNNVVHLPFDCDLIVFNANKYIDKQYEGDNIYFKENPTQNIIKVLKDEYASLL